MKINVLPQSIANMIAAGEVVERPASVVKELAENSVDAGAKSVTVEIKKGGMSYIRISDDGCGIAPNEVATAFKRHATSKIKTEEDLNAIYTLGFRGEALASIAAVSRVDIFTKTKENNFGYSLSIEGGEVIEESEAGCPDGTTITVKDLFYNTPARMKFLKNDSTETSYVTDAVNKLVLSHPEVAFKLIVNGKITLTSTGDGSVQSAVRAVFGRDYLSHMKDVEFEEGSIKVTGCIGSNALARKDRRQQVFFINGRYVKSKIISAALSEGYQNVMMVGKFPVAVIYITLSGNFVDVNVHPTKTEVRFSDDKKIYSSVFWAVKNALSKEKYVPEIDLSKKREYEEVLKVRKEISKEKNSAIQMDINLLKDTYTQNLAKNEEKENNELPKKEPTITAKKAEGSIAEELKNKIEGGSFFSKEEITSFKRSPMDKPSGDYGIADISIFKDEHTWFDKKEEIKPCENASSEEKTEEINKVNSDINIPSEDIKKEEKSIKISKPTLKANIDFKVAGQIFDTYIIVQKDDEMFIIDQHAAHERLYFENLVEEYRAKGVESQLLMVPVTVDFDPVKLRVALENTDVLASYGFECEEFGSNSIIVRSVPFAMPEDEVKDSLAKIVSLIEKGTNDIKKSYMEEVLHTMACKRAIKGNTHLGMAEMEALCEKVFAFDSINTCPHGRPIMTSMTKYELEKNFKRIV